MKKATIAGFIASILVTTGAAFADATDAALTTKGYVNEGLAFVYGVANSKASAESVTALTETVAGKADAADVTALTETVAGKADQSDLTTLSNAVNNEETGLATKASQADLTALQNQVDGLDIETYDNGTGIAIDDQNKIGLDLPDNPTSGAPYVYKPGTGWRELEVENSWNSTFLTNPNQNQQG
jgi:hypothetical protein